MIRLPPPQTLAPETQFALALLVDHARLLPASGGEAIGIDVLPAAREADRLDPATQLVTREGLVRVDEGALRLITRVAGVADEQRSNRADRFGRVPPEDNYLVARRMERDPIVSRFAVALRSAVIAAAGRHRVVLVAPWPEGRRWAMAMTHDLDVVALWPAFTALRAAELAGKGRIADVVTLAGAAVRGSLGDPVWSAARGVLDTERRAGIRSSWFVITGTPTVETMRAGDITYAAESPGARRIVEAVLAAGHEVGLHGSFETWTHADRFTAQRERLTRITARPVRGVRQHFLRMRPGTTHAAMHAAGFQYDSTCGFADRNGFRAGLADVHPAWQDAARQPVPLDVIPFVWMDRALSKYRGIEDPTAWVDDALSLARTCREVEGLWDGIWHPNLSAALGFPGAERAFEQLCARLMADAPWSATLGEVADWRRARRSLAAAGVEPDGRVRVTGTVAPQGIALEDGAGRPVAHAVA